MKNFSGAIRRKNRRSSNGRRRPRWNEEESVSQNWRRVPSEIAYRYRYEEDLDSRTAKNTLVPSLSSHRLKNETFIPREGNNVGSKFLLPPPVLYFRESFLFSFLPPLIIAAQKTFHRICFNPTPPPPHSHPRNGQSDVFPPFFPSSPKFPRRDIREKRKKRNEINGNKSASQDRCSRIRNRLMTRAPGSGLA